MREKEHIYAILKVGRYIKNGSLVMTQDIVKNNSDKTTELKVKYNNQRNL